MSSAPTYDTERSVTGTPGLDHILGGGLPANHMYLIEGNPGAGKTTLALRFLLAGRDLGEMGLYITLSETELELRRVAASHGWSLDGMEICELAPTIESLNPDAQYTMFHASDTELHETTQRLLAEVTRTGAKRVVIDSLSELRLLSQGSLRYRRQILALKQFFSGRECTVLLLDDNSAEGQDLQVQSIAHGVLQMQQLAPEFGGERRRLRISKLRGVQYSGGYHDFIIQRGGLRVFPRLIAADHTSDYPQEDLSSSVPELDALLGGGLRRGSSTLIMGPAGSGKTSLAVQFVATAAEAGEHATLFLFEESVASLTNRAENLGLDITRYQESGCLHIQQIDPAELAPGQFAQAIRDRVEQDNAKVVVIDSINGYLNAMPEERFLTIQLHELLSYLNRQGVVTILIVAQHGLIGTSMASPVDTSYLADAVVLLRYFEARGEVRQAVSVVKKRSGPHERTIRELRIVTGGIQVGKPLSEFRGVLTGVPHHRDGAEGEIQA